MKKKTGNITVFIIDDELSVRKALSHLLNSEGYDVEVFSSAGEFLSRSRYFGSGCIVLDINMEEMTGMELQEELIKKHNDLPVIFITGKGDIPTSVKAMKNGAVDFLTKPFDDDQLLSAVKEALMKMDSNIDKIIEKEKIHEEMVSLTFREKEVLGYVISGYMNKEISAELQIAEQTVKIHRGHLMRKLGVSSVAELVTKSEKAGVLPVKREAF